MKLIWESKRIIIATTATFSILAIIYSLSLPNIYESKALLSPVNEDIGSNQPMGNVTGLAPAAQDVVNKAANAVGIDMGTEYESLERYNADMRKVANQLIKD